MSSPPTVAPTHRAPELLDQTVVVIGGSAGIGLETARAAGAEGARVIITGRNPDLGAPGLRQAPDTGDLTPFHGWDKRGAAPASPA